VFDDLALVIEPEDVDAGPVAVAGPLLIAVKHDEVIVGQHSAEFNAFAGVLAGHAFEVFDERILSVGDDRIVLRVAGADVGIG
jgi:hypothetical protein